MKIFNKEPEHWSKKVNFVDENNVVLGYDMGQSCCEHADWFIADKPTLNIPDREKDRPGEIDLPGWNFDTAFFQEVKEIKDSPEDWNKLDSGGMVIFRIVKGDEEKFIHLFNCHNGYYSHGFDFKAGEAAIREGSL